MSEGSFQMGKLIEDHNGKVKGNEEIIVSFQAQI